MRSAEPKDAITRQYQQFFQLNDCKLTFTDKALRDMAALAIERGTGARGLRSIIENVMLDVLYEFPSHDNLEEFVVTPDVVRHKTFGRGRKTYRDEGAKSKKRSGKRKGRESA